MKNMEFEEFEKRVLIELMFFALVDYSEAQDIYGPFEDYTHKCFESGRYSAAMVAVSINERSINSEIKK